MKEFHFRQVYFCMSYIQVKMSSEQVNLNIRQEIKGCKVSLLHVGDITAWELMSYQERKKGGLRGGRGDDYVKRYKKFQEEKLPGRKEKMRRMTQKQREVFQGVVNSLSNTTDRISRIS